ncbi:MAG: hypothetical protein ACJ8ER_15865 [Allosphingosinicella sp.]
MNDLSSARPPAWFRIVSLLALLWEAFGVWQYLSFVRLVPTMGEMAPAEAALAARAPAWFTAAFAVAVFAGLPGALGLLLGKAWSRLLLILSVVAAIVQFGWWCFLSGGAATIGPSIYAMPAMIIVVGLLLVWLAGTGVKRGWLR